MRNPKKNLQCFFIFEFYKTDRVRDGHVTFASTFRDQMVTEGRRKGHAIVSKMKIPLYSRYALISAKRYSVVVCGVSQLLNESPLSLKVLGVHRALSINLLKMCSLVIKMTIKLIGDVFKNVFSQFFKNSRVKWLNYAY